LEKRDKLLSRKKQGRFLILRQENEEQGLAIVKADIMKELAVKILKGLGNLSKGINDEE